MFPRTIESSTTTTPLARDLGERVELQPDALLAQPLVGLDERPADVAVLDQALAERDAGRAREADRGRRARVGDRQHEVGVDRRLGGEPLAHPHARAVRLDARRAASRAGRGRRTRRCRARRARRAAPPARSGTPASSIRTSSPGRDLALEVGADEVERARLGGDDPVAVEPAEHERPEAVRVAEREQLPSASADDRVRALEPRHRARDRLLERPRVARDQRGDQLAVGGRARADALGASSSRSSAAFDEVAVVAERDRAAAAVVDERLRVRPARRARSSSSACARSRGRR